MLNILKGGAKCTFQGRRGYLYKLFVHNKGVFRRRKALQSAPRVVRCWIAMLSLLWKAVPQPDCFHWKHFVTVVIHAGLCDPVSVWKNIYIGRALGEGGKTASA